MKYSLLWIGIALLMLIFAAFYPVNKAPSSPAQLEVVPSVPKPTPVSIATSTTPKQTQDLEEFTGPVYHIFFHSLIIYPEQAQKDIENLSGYRDYMITVAQFQEILQQLYDNSFILIDSKLLYTLNSIDNTIQKNKLLIPKGKRPLIISIDDVSYYNYMRRGGFANKLVLQNGIVKTEVITPEGETKVTNDGDVVPIVDSFVTKHPDFSFNGAKGIIALTGFEGILGYDTHQHNSHGDTERSEVEKVIRALKKNGWTFASHSYSHDAPFSTDTISETYLQQDIALWQQEVLPLVGPTNIFIGPFGQIFRNSKTKQQLLLDAGFTELHGVGMDGALDFFDTYITMNRLNIDGYRIRNNPTLLNKLLGITVTTNF